MIEVLISFGLYTALLALNKKLRIINFFLVAFLCSIALMSFLIFIIKLNYKPFIVPITFLLIFQPIRYLFLERKKREPILYLRGVQLTPQEQYDISIEDYLFTAISVIIPIFAWVLFYL